MPRPGGGYIRPLRADPVYRPPGGLPGVVRRARPELGSVHDHAWVASDLLGTLRVTKQVRVVLLLPHENEVHGSHVVGDERAAGGRARERVGGDAEPA